MKRIWQNQEVELLNYSELGIHTVVSILGKIEFDSAEHHNHSYFKISTQTLNPN